MSETIRLTVAQACIRFLKNQYLSLDGEEYQFFKGCFGIFGHGNVAGIGQALQEAPEFPYVPFRNEQGMVHSAVGYAKTMNRLSTFACTSSIGPGATNMLTGAALATINRIPVLLLPGDQFADRRNRPVLQELESPEGDMITVNDCFRPVSKYWNRINHPQELIPSLLVAMEMLTSPSNTGAVTISLPQDIQAQAFDFIDSDLEKRVWKVERVKPLEQKVLDVTNLIRSAKRPLVIAGGGVKYSLSSKQLTDFIKECKIPVVETMAGKGSIPWDLPLHLGSCGVTGTRAGNEYARQADLVIGIGTRYTDFTTASYTLFENTDVRFVNINVNEADANKMDAYSIVADAKEAIEILQKELEGWRVTEQIENQVQKAHLDWQSEVDEYYNDVHDPMTQATILGVLNDQITSSDIIVNASGSIPGDLHKLWRTSDVEQFHMEYGYSCMGYEIAGGLGVKIARPEKEVFVIVGDGGYLMLAQEIITSIQEGYKLIILLIDNQGYKSIGSLSRSIGSVGFGTRLLKRSKGDIPKDDSSYEPDMSDLNIDYMDNASSMGAKVYEAHNPRRLMEVITMARCETQTTLIYTTCDRYKEVESFAWWDVPIAEVSNSTSVREAHENYLRVKAKQRFPKSTIQ